MNTFQLVVIGIFIFLAVFSVLVFSGAIPLPGVTRAPVQEVTWWATIPDTQAAGLINNFNTEYEDRVQINYVEKDSRTLEADLIEALAAGRGPDLILAPQELIFKHADKLTPFSYDQIERRRFTDTFIEEGDLFLYPAGVVALPLAVDPLLLYYNRDFLNTARIVNPPRDWKELETQNKALTQADARSNITRSAIALGTFSNINNAKDILALLILQAGNPLVMRGGDGAWRVTIAEDFLGTGDQQAALATTFFNRFSDSSNLLYSWNSALPEAQQMFIRNSLAMYLGYASEYDLIRRQNPQINFDLAPVPQPSESTRGDITLGRLYGLAVLRASPKAAAAAQAAVLLAWSNYAKDWSDLMRLPPTRRDLLAVRPADPVAAAFYDSALIAHGWYDLNITATAGILRNLAESVRQQRVEVGSALAQTQRQLEAFLPAAPEP